MHWPPIADEPNGADATIGADDAPDNQSGWPVSLIGALLFGGLAYWSGWFTPLPDLTLTAKILDDSRMVTITNDDGFAWDAVKVTINGSYRCRYLYISPATTPRRVAPGAEILIHTAESCSTAEGSRFDLGTTRVARITVEADTPSGPRDWVGGPVDK